MIRFQLVRKERFQKLRTIETMGPNLYLAHRWTRKGQDLKGEDDPFEKKLITAAAAQDDHPIRGVSVSAILHLPLLGRDGKAHVGTIQLEIKAELATYS